MSETDEKLTRLEGRVSKLERKVSTKLYTDSKKKIVTVRKEMLSISEAAEYLGLEVSGLRMLMHKKQIPYYKPNGKVCYFDPKELKEWQKRKRQTPSYELSEKEQQS